MLAAQRVFKGLKGSIITANKQHYVQFHVLPLTFKLNEYMQKEVEGNGIFLFRGELFYLILTLHQQPTSQKYQLECFSLTIKKSK